MVGWRKRSPSRSLQPYPGEETFQRLARMPRAVSSLVIQLRTGKIGFRAFLCQRKVPGFDSPICQDCNAGEDMTVTHVLLKCSKWAELRRECLQRAGCTQAVPQLVDLLNSRKGCLAAARMVWKTELLEQYQTCNMESAGDNSDDEAERAERRDNKVDQEE